MLIPSTITARRTRRYTSTWYIHPTAHKHDFEPMDGRGRYIFQPPQCQAVNPSRWSTLPPPFTGFTTQSLRRSIEVLRGYPYRANRVDSTTMSLVRARRSSQVTGPYYCVDGGCPASPLLTLGSDTPWRLFDVFHVVGGTQEFPPQHLRESGCLWSTFGGVVSDEFRAGLEGMGHLLYGCGSSVFGPLVCSVPLLLSDLYLRSFSWMRP